jgi:long-chain acyl-CoA synthetase
VKLGISADLIREHATQRPDSPCVTFDGRTLSYRDLDARSNRVANALTDAGVGPGERVAIIARNSPAFYELTFGCAKSGIVFVPINWRLSPREVDAILDDATPRLVFAGAEQFALIPESIRGSVTCLNVDTEYATWRDSASAVDPKHPVDIDAALALLYTSGTTGMPKGVMISQRNLSFSARMAREIWRFTADSVNLVAMPLFHIGGLGYGMMALTQGGHTVLLQQPAPALVLDAIQQHRVTHAFFVPTVIQLLVNFEGVNTMELSSLQLIVYGASPINETLLLRAIEVFGCGFSHAYGLTETTGTVVTLLPEEHDPGGPDAGRLRSCGRAVPWAELGLFEPTTGERVAVGTVGEIWIRSGMTTSGYWHKPDETAAALRADGWLRTGDAATQDNDGYVYIRDRFKDMIVSGAENVFPAEVENVLSQHPAVAEVAVIGVPHGRWGETVKAIVVTRAGTNVTAADLIAFARNQLAHYKCPTSVNLVASLPKSASGKILKRELRAMLWDSGEPLR